MDRLPTAATYQAWRREQLPDPVALARSRAEARASVAAQSGEMRAAVERSHGLTLPDSVFAAVAFWRGLATIERAAVEDYAMFRPCGLLERLIYDTYHRAPKGGIDPRLDCRYYCDPPEFLNLCIGEGDGHHYGLWYDVPDRPSFVASYYSNDCTTIDPDGSTVLEALRMAIELRADTEIVQVAEVVDVEDRELLAEARDGILHLDLARDAVCEYETGDRAEQGESYYRRYGVDLGQRVPTAQGMGVLLPHHYHQPDRQARVARFSSLVPESTLAEWTEVALGACAAGHPGEALALGHDLHWLSAGDAAREAFALALLDAAYRALGRDALADIAAVHHRHRHLPDVDIY